MMSWIYTILFSGLLFAGQADMPAISIPEVVSAPAAQAPLGDETERFSQTYPLSANGRVNVSNVNGPVAVEGWDRSEVKLEYVKTADTKERLSEVEIKIDARADSFSVETDYGERKDGHRWKNNGKLTVEYRLMVPRGAVLDEAETVNGSVTVSGMTNSIEASAVNGQVTVTNVRGTAKLSTVNGGVNADLDEIPSGSSLELETVNGQVLVTIPSDSSAVIKADSLNGDIRNDFGLTVRKGRFVGRDLYGRLGSGDAQIKLSSVNGGLTISRKNDGKPLSPATNLLTNKDQRRDDEDADARRLVRDMDLRELQKVANESAKISEQVVKDEEIVKAVSEAARRGEIGARMFDVNFFQSAPRMESKTGSFVLSAKPAVTIEAGDTAVAVRGWDKSEVQYRVTQLADPRLSPPLNVTETHTNSSVRLRVENAGDDRERQFFSARKQVRIEVFVPVRSDVKITTEGEIRIDGVSGDIQLDGDDEAINVRDAEGKLRVVNSDGRIRVIGFRGEIDAETGDGAISLEGDFERLRAHAIDGSIILTLAEDTNADLETNCPDMIGDGINLVRAGSGDQISRYRIGKGGPLYKLETEGTISVRGNRSITQAR
ncbi:MAG: hypothetical protein IPM59_13830 [Chloracidobacterium sp.]|nr:hypothetical protein [Chloracidobacterium sp.]